MDDDKRRMTVLMLSFSNFNQKFIFAIKISFEMTMNLRFEIIQKCSKDFIFKRYTQQHLKTIFH